MNRNRNRSSVYKQQGEIDFIDGGVAIMLPLPSPHLSASISNVVLRFVMFA